MRPLQPLNSPSQLSGVWYRNPNKAISLDLHHWKICKPCTKGWTIASVDHVANLADLRLILTLGWTDAFLFGCACFLKAYFTHDKHIKMHKEPCVYYIYEYKYILYILFCKSCFELQNVWMQCIMGYWARCKKLQWFVPTEIPLQEMK